MRVFERDIPKRLIYLIIAIFVSIGLGFLEASWTNTGGSCPCYNRTRSQTMLGCLGIFMAIFPLISWGERWLTAVSIIEGFLLIMILVIGAPSKPLGTWGYIISSGTVITVVLFLIRPENIVNLHWVPLMAVIEEWSHVFSHGSAPWLGGRILNHWSTSYTGISLYPYITFPIIFGIGEVLLFIKSKKGWEISKYINW